MRIVANAGGLNPAGLADRLREVATRPRPRRRRSPTSRATTCGPRRELGLGGALTANAYLGGFGIAAALARRRRRRRHRPGHRRLAGRRARRSPTSAGRPTAYDALAGAVVAGHVIECGTQATGGNFSGFLRPARTTARRSASRSPRSRADGSSRDHQARRHRRRGHRRHRHRAAGLRDPVRRATSAPTSPPAWTRSSSRQAGPDRVAVTGVRGEAPPERLKVCVNELGGFRNTRRVRADRPRHRGQGRLGARAARRRALTAGVGHLDPHGTAPPPTPTPRRPRRCLLRCTVHGPVARPGRPGVHRRRRRARAGVLPRLHA